MYSPSGTGLARRLRTGITALWSDGRGWALVTVSAGWFLSLGVRLIFPALLPLIRAAFELSLATAGLLLTLLWFSYAVGQFPGGILGDRLGDRNILVISTLLSAIVVLAIVLSTRVWLFFLATVIFGFATALYGPTRFTVVSSMYPNRDGAAIGITLAAGNVGNAVLPVIAGSIAVYTSWRLGVGFVVPFFLLTAVALWLTVPKSSGAEASAVDTLSVSSLARIVSGVSNRPVMVVGTQMVLLMFAWHGFTGFYPTYLVVEKQLDQQVASLLFSSFFAIGIVIQPIAGACSDWVGPKKSLLVVTGSTVLALLTLPFANSIPALIGVTVLATGLLGIGPIASGFLVNAVPEDMRGSGLGLIRSGYIMIASTGSVFVGLMADFGRFDEAYFVLAAVAFVGFLLCQFVPSR